MSVSTAELRRRVARNIRALAEKRGLSLQQLADLAAINLSHFSRALNGKQAFTLDRLAKVAEALDVDPATLLRAGNDDVEPR